MIIVTKHWRTALASLLIVFGCLSGCAQQPSASLYSSLGGDEGIAEIVDNLVTEIGSREALLEHFRESSVPRFKSQLQAFICAAADGPCQYQGDNMVDTHAGMDISESEFNLLVEAFVAAMDSADLSLSTQNRLLAKLAPYRPQIIYK